MPRTTRAGRRAPLVATLLLIAGVVSACGAPAERIVQARLDGRPLDLLVAGPDGMRGREFGDTDGMLFTWAAEQDPGAVRFVMDGVPMPLDVAFFDGAGRWIGSTAMEPCRTEPCERYEAPGPFRWAVEAPAGAYLMDLPAGSRLEVPR